MTTHISDDGTAEAVTLLSVDDNVVTQIKTAEKDTYTAVQLGTQNAKILNKPTTGHVKKAKIMPKIMREVRVSELGEIKIGDKFGADLFNPGDVVDVTATSKGKGFAGTIKRYNFHRQRKTHGGKGNTRKLGSIGSMYPQKIFKGKKMPGHMGAARTTVKNLKVALVDADKKVIGIYGAVPGPRKALVIVKGTQNG